MSIKKFSLKVLSSKDYDKLAEKYPKKIRQRIIDSKGFSDMKRMIAFVRGGKDTLDTAGTAMHEILELVSKVSPHEEANLRFKGTKITQSAPQMTPEQQSYYTNIYQPYTQSQYQTYQNSYQPLIGQVGNQVASNLTNGITSPQLTLPEDKYADIWQQAAGQINQQYGSQKKQLGQQLASTGALSNSGQSTKAFANLNTQQSATLENQAVQQAIQSWQDQKQVTEANWQQSITNQQLPMQQALQYLQTQPQFNMQMPSTQLFPSSSMNLGSIFGW